MVNTPRTRRWKTGAGIFIRLRDVVINAPRRGAAGGMGAALLGTLNAELRAGVEIVVETLQRAGG